jgi:hypothetical protein
MPDKYYAVVTSHDLGHYYYSEITNKTVTGFDFNFYKHTTSLKKETNSDTGEVTYTLEQNSALTGAGPNKNSCSNTSFFGLAGGDSSESEALANCNACRNQLLDQTTNINPISFAVFD